MFLESSDVRKIDNTRNMIQKVCEKDTIVYCKHCDGTGLKDFKMGGHWNGEYCDYCKGYGFRGDKIIPTSYELCPKCDGFGCEQCFNKGYVDWITVIRLGIKKKKK